MLEMNDLGDSNIVIDDTYQVIETPLSQLLQSTILVIFNGFDAWIYIAIY